jgi:hypothetical protein
MTACGRAGLKYLEENSKKEGVVTTASGLQYKVCWLAVRLLGVAPRSARARCPGRPHACADTHAPAHSPQ